MLLAYSWPLAQLEPSFTTTDDQLLLEEVRSTFDVYETAVHTLVGMVERELIGNANPELHRFMAAEVRPVADELEVLSHGLIARKLEAANAGVFASSGSSGFRANRHR